MDDYPVITALEQLWDDLAPLCGDAWDELEAELRRLLAEFAAAEAEEARRRASARIQRLLRRRAPDAHRKLAAFAAELEAAPRTYSTRGDESFTAGAEPEAALEPAAAALPAPITRYTDILCPNKVWVKSPYVPVIVRLTVRAPEFSRDAQPLEVSAALPVRVHITAPAFDLLTAADQEITVLPDRDSQPVAFLLKPREAGPAEVILDFTQNGVPIGRTASLAIEVTEQPADEALSSRPAAPLAAIPPGVSPADLMLVITHERFRDQPQLRFTLYRGGEVGAQDFTPMPLESDPQQVAARLYSDLDRLGERAYESPEKVSRAVKRLAQNAWRDLIPEDLKQLYEAERASWAGKSLAVISDEPYLPWELVWPYGRGWEDDGPWCVTARMTRWLRRDAQRRGNATAPAQLPLSALACIAPPSDLSHTASERALLADLAGRRGLRDLSPATADLDSVLALLEDGEYNWVHVATHGSFDASAPDRASGISLEGADWLTPADVVGPRIEDHLDVVRPAFLFNVCHGARAGWGLTRMEGWAERLIGAGAGLFVSPAWSAEDAAAEAFARAFYAGLEAGEAIGEAARAARLAARDAAPGDPTWLAYSVYAHPNARVAWPAG